MRQSELFSKTERQAPKDEVALNAQLLIRAGYVQKLMAGVYSLLPLGLKVVRNIEGIVRTRLEKVGAHELLLPALHPRANWDETGRWETYDSLFRFTSFYSKNDYVLGPTHEEIVSPLMQHYLSSYKDLPKAVFQIQTKFRDEKRAKSGLLRGREFIMKDLYSFHVDEADLDLYYEKVKEVYTDIFAACGLGEYTVLTFASGGTFAKYSHEFQTLSAAGEDTVYLCTQCRIGINKEIIEEQNTCPQCGSKDLQEKTGIEVGNIFKLKTKYSAPFGLRYRDAAGKETEVIMGCYGIGITRLLGTIAEIHHDEGGLKWPRAVAPFQVHLLELKGASGEDWYRDLQARGVTVLYDDRQISAGEKLADADLLGLPWRAVVSAQTGEKVELKVRGETETKLLDREEFLAIVSS